MSLIFLLLFAVSCIIHEIGHYSVATYYHANPTFGHHGLDPYVNATAPEWESPEKQRIIQRNIGLSGISFQGIFFLPLTILFAMDALSLVIAVSFLFIGSHSDLRQIRKILKEKSE